MLRFALALLVVVSGLSGLASLRAQDPTDPVVICRMCKNQGRKDCSKHGKALLLEHEADVKSCSVVAVCKTCEGALAVDCTQCKNEPVEAELLRRRALVAEWLQQKRARVAAAKGVASFLYLETTHYDLTFSLRAATVDKKKIDPHALMHLYGQRLETLRSLYATTLGLTDVDLPDRMRIYMFDDLADHGVIGPQETGMGNALSSGIKLMGPEFVYSMHQERRTMADDEKVHRNIVHSVTHLLLSQMRPMKFLGNIQHGWLDEGVAHWFEEKLTGKCMNFCFEEVLLQPGAGFKNGHWRVPVRRTVDAGEAMSFASLSTLNTDQLTFEQHAFAFAFVDFLITGHGGAKFRDFLRLVKAGTATRDALKTTYGWSPLSIDEVFRAWVQANYPLK